MLMSASDLPPNDRFCIVCSYSLRGLEGNKCPECGHSFGHLCLDGYQSQQFSRRPSIREMLWVARRSILAAFSPRSFWATYTLSRPSNFFALCLSLVLVILLSITAYQLAAWLLGIVGNTQIQSTNLQCEINNQRGTIFLRNMTEHLIWLNAARIGALPFENLSRLVLPGAITAFALVLCVLLLLTSPVPVRCPASVIVELQLSIFAIAFAAVVWGPLWCITRFVIGISASTGIDLTLWMLIVDIGLLMPIILYSLRLGLSRLGNHGDLTRRSIYVSSLTISLTVVLVVFWEFA